MNQVSKRLRFICRSNGLFNLEAGYGKSRKHASNACGQFLKEMWTFLDQQQLFVSFYLLSKLIFLSKNNPGFKENIQCVGKNYNEGHFYMLRNWLNLWTFLKTENCGQKSTISMSAWRLEITLKISVTKKIPHSVKILVNADIPFLSKESE